eukprot:SAG31_NODE_2878_length_4963_cov_9.998150_1_plen_103_part_00
MSVTILKNTPSPKSTQVLARRQQGRGVGEFVPASRRAKDIADEVEDVNDDDGSSSEIEELEDEHALDHPRRGGRRARAHGTASSHQTGCGTRQNHAFRGKLN